MKIGRINGTAGSIKGARQGREIVDKLQANILLNIGEKKTFSSNEIGKTKRRRVTT